MHLLEPGHLEEDCPIKMVSVNKRLSLFFGKLASNVHKINFECCFLRVQEVQIQTVALLNLESYCSVCQNTWESFVFRNCCDWTIFFHVPRFKIVALQLLGNLFNCFYFFNLLNLTDITCFCFYRQILLETFWINHLAKVVNHLASQR